MTGPPECPAMVDDDSEAASETSQARRRPAVEPTGDPPERKVGRPRHWPDDNDFVKLVAEHYPGVRTRRGLNDLCYRHWALLVLHEDEDPRRYLWLVDFDAWEAGDPMAVHRPSVLTELGRFMHRGDICAVAQYLCEEVEPKPTTKQAVQKLKHLRVLGPEGDSLTHLLSNEQWLDLIRERGLEQAVLDAQYEQKVDELRRLLAEVKALEAARSGSGQPSPAGAL